MVQCYLSCAWGKIQIFSSIQYSYVSGALFIICLVPKYFFFLSSHNINHLYFGMPSIVISSNSHSPCDGTKTKLSGSYPEHFLVIALHFWRAFWGGYVSYTSRRACAVTLHSLLKGVVVFEISHSCWIITFKITSGIFFLIFSMRLLFYCCACICRTCLSLSFNTTLVPRESDQLLFIGGHLLLIKTKHHYQVSSYHTPLIKWMMKTFGINIYNWSEPKKRKFFEFQDRLWINCC